MATQQNGGFGIYLHWPFCEAKCPYCDFNSHVASAVDYDAWLAAFLKEIDRLSAGTEDKILRSVFFGGGTPSLMPPQMVEKTLDRINQTWRQTNDIEITLEANPSSVEAARFNDFKMAGINRVSLGIQALNDKDLKLLGRVHSTSQALAALDVAANTFDRYSFDLIYARQFQTLPEWEAELGQALSFGAKHMSLYQLTIEPETVFGRRASVGKLPGLLDEDLSADMFELTQEMCSSAGLPAYEISNHAVEGEESRHNQIYWSGGDFLGIGPGAHGRLTIDGQRIATETWLAPNRWLDHAAAGNGESKREVLDGTNQANEYLMMGLRTTDGISLNRLENMLGRPFSVPDQLTDQDLIKIKGRSLQATPQGRMILNHLVENLLVE